MSYARQNNRVEIQISAEKELVHQAALIACQKVGTVKEDNQGLNYIVMKTPMKMFPPQNPTTIRISLHANQSQYTDVKFESESLDGSIGLGSAGKTIDNVIKELNRSMELVAAKSAYSEPVPSVEDYELPPLEDEDFNFPQPSTGKKQLPPL